MVASIERITAVLIMPRIPLNAALLEPRPCHFLVAPTVYLIDDRASSASSVEEDLGSLQS